MSLSISSLELGPDIDLDLVLLKTNPLEALQSLQSKLPQAAPRLRRQQHLLCPLCCSSDAEVADAALKLLDQLAEPAATFHGGRRCFCHRSVEVEYWELDEDPQSDLLFGYGVWPAAQSLSRFLIDATLEVSSDSHPVPSVKGKSVLEIGAGVALAGLSCHACGAVSVHLTDGETRLVEALKEHHGEKNGLTFGVLDWNLDQGQEQFDIILASDVLLSCCGAPKALPAVLARRLRPSGRALLMNMLRNVHAHTTAIAQMQSHGLSVSIFVVSSELLPITIEQISKLPDSTQILLVATCASLDTS